MQEIVCPQIIESRTPIWEPEGHRIFREEAERSGTSIKILRGYSRAKSMVEARHRAIYRMATETGLTLPQIGMVVNRDHTTVGASIVKYCRRTGAPLPRGLTDISYHNKHSAR